MSLQRCQRETTSTEFLSWQAYMRKEMNIPRREDFYFAQIAAEMRRSVSKHPEAPRTEHFLLSFATDSGKKKEVLSDVEIEQHVMASKAYWFAVVGKNSEEK